MFLRLLAIQFYFSIVDESQRVCNVARRSLTIHSFGTMLITGHEAPEIDFIGVEPLSC
jgi:hypothetical protein